MIRKLTPDDKELYLQLSDEFYHTQGVLHPIPESYRLACFNECMRSDVYAEGYIFEYDSVPVGYALTSKTFSQEAGGIVVWLEEGYVRPEFQSRGLCTEFFKFIEKHIPASRYRLEVEPDNTRAIALYKRMGYDFLPYSQMISERGQNQK